MSHRVDHNREALIEHLTEREWHPKEVESFVRMIGHSALESYQSALNILEYQQAVDEQVQAEKQCDEVFAGQGRLFEESEALEPGFIQRLE